MKSPRAIPGGCAFRPREQTHWLLETGGDGVEAVFLARQEFFFRDLQPCVRPFPSDQPGHKAGGRVAQSGAERRPEPVIETPLELDETGESVADELQQRR